MLDNITVVLNKTWHPGNIGSALRAMKTMGLSRLILVKPRLWPHGDVQTMAAGAEDLISQVTLCDSLEQAIAPAHLVVATSARVRGFSWPQITARECAARVIDESARGHQIALVFGQEKTGLQNEELQLCNLHAMIPANPGYGVLNVACAVQIVCYEIWQAFSEFAEQESNVSQSEDSPAEDTLRQMTETYPRQKELSDFYRHLESSLRQIGFIIAKHPGEVMTKLRRLFNRARPEQTELNILRGILARIDQHAMDRPEQKH